MDWFAEAKAEEISIMHRLPNKHDCTVFLLLRPVIFALLMG